MITVSGATGNVGSEVVRILRAQGVSVAGLSRQAHAGEPDMAWRVLEPADTGSAREALEGADKLALITSAGEDMFERERALVQAAADAGVSHVVKLSGLGAGPDAPIKLPQQHFKTEELIKSLGLVYTFVRPNLFMQTLLASAQTVRDSGTLYAPAGDGAISFTDVRDVAAVIAAALTQTGHDNEIYEITGPDAFTFAQVAALFSQELGKDVTFVDVAPDDAREGMLSSGLSPWLADAFVELYGIYRAGYGAAVLPGPIEKVTGRPAASLTTFLRQFAGQF
nr:SDR family oxidoreductase [Flexivirga aerilata]